MHEVSIAQTIIETVLDEQKNYNWPEVKTVGVRVGSLSGVFADALEFGFDALKKDTPLKNSIIKIENVHAQARCSPCDAVFSVDNLVFSCPRCGNRHVELIRGQELDISFIEVDEE